MTQRNYFVVILFVTRVREWKSGTLILKKIHTVELINHQKIIVRQRQPLWDVPYNFCFENVGKSPENTYGDVWGVFKILWIINDGIFCENT